MHRRQATRVASLPPLRLVRKDVELVVRDRAKTPFHPSPELSPRSPGHCAAYLHRHSLGPGPGSPSRTPHRGGRGLLPAGYPHGPLSPPRRLDRTAPSTRVVGLSRATPGKLAGQMRPAVFFAFGFPLSTAIVVSFSSAFFSSLRVCCRRSTTAFSFSIWAYVRAVPYPAIS